MALNEAEIPMKKSCIDADEYKTKICPDEYSLINDRCFKVDKCVFVMKASIRV